MRLGWQIASVCFIVLFALAAFHALSLPLQDALGPGPGFFPLSLALLGALFAILVLVEVSRPGQFAFAGAIDFPNRAGVLKIVAVLAMVAAAAALLDRLGYSIVAFGFCAILLPVMGARNPFVIAAFSLVGSFGVFHVFYYWLKVPLPTGVLGN